MHNYVEQGNDDDLTYGVVFRVEYCTVSGRWRAVAGSIISLDMHNTTQLKVEAETPCFDFGDLDTIELSQLTGCYYLKNDIATTEESFLTFLQSLVFRGLLQRRHSTMTWVKVKRWTPRTTQRSSRTVAMALRRSGGPVWPCSWLVLGFRVLRTRAVNLVLLGKPLS